MSDSENDTKEPPHFTLIWTIENMSVPCFVKSPIFTVKEMEMTKWFLGVCDSESDSEFLNVSIARDAEDDGPKSIEIQIELAFLSTDGLPLIKKVEVIKFESTNTELNFFKFADAHEVLFRRRVEFLPKDALRVRCRMWRTGTEIAQPDLCFARSRLRPHRHFFVWTIREFSSLQKDKVRKIILKTASKKHLTLELFVTEEDGVEYISINPIISADFYYYEYATKICILDFEGKAVHSEENDSGEFVKFFKKDRLMNDKELLLPNDILSLRCEIVVDAEIVGNVIENYRYLNSMSSNVTETDTGDILINEEDEDSNVSDSLTDDVESLLKEGTLSDAILQAGSKSVPAHKCILSARSPVFKAMFTGDMKEKTSKSVEIPDIEEDTLRKLLSYIYTDTVGELEWRGAINLYRAADKYELLNLKKMCSTTLKNDLSVNNVCAILSVADLHQDRELREAAEEFVLYQKKDFFTSDTWKSFKAENAVLALEIVERILCNI